MSTAPIINVSNVANSSAAANKVGNGSSSDHSFGQVLSQEVNSRNDANATPGNANGNSASTPASTSTSTPTSTPTSTSTSTTPTTPTSSGTGTGKTSKNKSSDTSSQASGTPSTASANPDASTASNASAQLLALVTNVQQTVTDSKGSAPATTNDAISGVSLVGGATGLAAQAQAAQVVASATDSAANAASDAQASDGSAQTTASTLKNLGITERTSTSTAHATAVDSTNLVSQTDKQSVSALQAAASAASSLDLAASAEKNIQACLATLDTNALKIEQAAQTTPAATALTQQAIASTQAPPINPGETLTPRVGASGWDQAVGQKVVWMAAGGQQSASLTLNPPDLGPMQVVLNVTNSHATVTFSAAQPEVRQALESALPRLREMLGDAGIQLGQASINSGSAQQQNGSAQQGSGSSGRSGNTVSASETAISTTGAMSTSAGLGLVDTFA